MQPPYESESGLAPSLVADANSWPQPPHFGRLYGSSLRRVFRTASGCVLFCLVPGGYVVSKPVIPPESEKPARALPRSRKVSEAQYQLLSNRCQEENAKYG